MRALEVTIGDEIAASQAVEEVRERCKHLDPAVRQQIVETVQDIACDLERRGQELASIGSQFRTVQALNLHGCSVKIIAAYGIPHCGSPITRFWSLFRRS